MSKTKTEKVCVKWVKEKCVEWQERPDGGLELNLSKCPRKLRTKIRGQMKKGFSIKTPLEPTSPD